MYIMDGSGNDARIGEFPGRDNEGVKEALLLGMDKYDNGIEGYGR